mgnify:CR=1 FL=1
MEQRIEDGLSPYRVFSRAEWAELRQDTPMTLTREEVTRVRSLHDLHLVDIGGKEGALASISFPDARVLLSELLRIGTPAATATCPHCAAPIGPGARFCPECGTSLHGPTACAKCGIDLPAGSRYCAACGSRVAA